MQSFGQTWAARFAAVVTVSIAGFVGVEVGKLCRAGRLPL
jgi:hypothetical protein